MMNEEKEIVMVGKRKEVLMFGAGQRFVHWLHTAAFIVLTITGAMIYIPWLGESIARGDGGHVVRLVHRVGAIAFMLVPVLYVIFDPKELWADIKRLLTWGKDDVGWFKAAPRYYFLGDEEAMPPQDKFNTGQKIFYLVVAICMGIFIITGLIMWFGKGTVLPSFVVPTWVFQWSVFLHDLSMIAYVASFLLHLMLAVAHPLMRGAIDEMIFGWMTEDYVKSHHPKYYEKIKERSE
jgi:formate dehydrogenase subunit gamma